MTYTLDQYKECITNDEGNAAQVVQDLFNRGHVVTTWTDGEGTKFDLLWSFDATRIGRSSMVDNGPGKLFVGIVKKGCWGFGLGYGYLSPDYVGEKLSVNGITAVKLASFISAVRGGLMDEVKIANQDYLDRSRDHQPEVSE